MAVPQRLSALHVIGESRGAFFVFKNDPHGTGMAAPGNGCFQSGTFSGQLVDVGDPDTPRSGCHTDGGYLGGDGFCFFRTRAGQRLIKEQHALFREI